MKSNFAVNAEARVYSGWLIYSRVLLLVLFAGPAGLLIYAIASRNAGAGTASVAVGITLGIFYQRVGRLLLRDLRRRRDRALAGQKKKP